MDYDKNMKDISFELKNLDLLKEFIFNDLIGENENKDYINEAINTYAERYHEMKLKLESKNKKTIVKTLLHQKAKKNNTIDLNAYAIGLEAMYDALHE